MARPTVIKFQGAASVPDTMRHVAQEIEAGKYGDVQFVAVALVRVGDTSTPEVFCWGRASNLEIAGAFALAHHGMVE